MGGEVQNARGSLRAVPGGLGGPDAGEQRDRVGGAGLPPEGGDRRDLGPAAGERREALAARRRGPALRRRAAVVDRPHRDEAAAVKHVVVLTDGEFQMSQVLALSREAHRMRTGSRITLSIISIVDDGTDPDFKVQARNIAREGGGVFVATGAASTVPVLVSGEVTRALSRVGRKPNVPGDGDREPPPEAPKDKPRDEPPPDDPPPPPPPEEPERPVRLPVYPVTDSPLLLPDPRRWSHWGGDSAPPPTTNHRTAQSVP